MKRITEDIKAGKYAGVYVLYGPESYMRRLYLNSLLKALGAEEGSMNYTVFGEDNVSEEAVISICGTLPFFAERRIVLIDDTGLLKKKADKLADYIEALPDHVVIIFNEAAVDKRSRLYKACAKYSRIVEFALMDEKALQDQTLRILAASGKKIRRSTMDLFLSGAGNDMGYITCELEKLIAYTGDRAEVTPEDVNAICSPVIEDRIFDLVSAVASGNRKEALDRYKELAALKEGPMKILVLIERQFAQLLHIKQLRKEGVPQARIASILKIHPYAVKKGIPLAGKYSEEELKDAVAKMVSLEEDVKTGRLSDTLAAELAVIGPV